MRVTDITSVNTFMEIIDKCEGKVELVSEQGDRLNLSSKISQFAAIVKILTDGSIQQLEIISYSIRDAENLTKLISC